MWAAESCGCGEAFDVAAEDPAVVRPALSRASEPDAWPSEEVEAETASSAVPPDPGDDDPDVDRVGDPEFDLDAETEAPAPCTPSCVPEKSPEPELDRKSVV